MQDGKEKTAWAEQLHPLIPTRIHITQHLACDQVLFILKTSIVELGRNDENKVPVPLAEPDLAQALSGCVSKADPEALTSLFL